MKRYYFFPLVVTFVILFSSCNRGDVIDVEIQDHPNIHEITYDQALKNLNDYLDGYHTQTKSSRKPVVTDYYYWSNKLTKSGETESGLPIPVYVFNFENNGGFAIVSGDDRTEPLFALTESGSLTPEHTAEDFPPGFGVFLAGLQNSLMSAGFSDGDGGSGYVEPKDTPDDNPDGLKLTVVYGPKDTINAGTNTTAMWNQDAPWNLTCPYVSTEIFGSTIGNEGYALVGCVAVATATIMDYHKHPSTIRWDLISGIRHKADYYDINISRGTTDAHRKAVNDLLSSLGRWGNLRMNYGLKGSGARGERVPITLRNQGYSSSDLEYVDNGRIKSEIWNNRPVYVEGFAKRIEVLGIVFEYTDGHGWVIDRMRQIGRNADYYSNGVYTFTQFEGITQFYCNWGWGGLHNGYFTSNAFKPKSDGNHYRFDMKMVTNIKPN